MRCYGGDQQGYFLNLTNLHQNEFSTFSYLLALRTGQHVARLYRNALSTSDVIQFIWTDRCSALTLTLSKRLAFVVCSFPILLAVPGSEKGPLRLRVDTHHLERTNQKCSVVYFERPR